MAVAKPFSKEKLAEYCRENRITWLAIHEADVVRRNVPDIDVYLLVEFEEGHKGGYFELFRIERELAEFFGGLRTDLRTLPELRDWYRDEVLAEAETLFAA